jgi:CRP-like cAMP-binding protein
MNPEVIPVWKPCLRRVAILRDLSEEGLGRVAALLKPLSLPKGATVFRQGDPSDSFYIIASGQVRLVSERQGRSTVLAYLGRGETLGELALLTGEPRPATALLDATTEFLVLSRKDFAALLGENPAVLVQLSRTLAARFLEETRGREEAQALEPELLALVGGLGEPDRTLLALMVANALTEQTRRRVLLVDMQGGGGAIAASLGFDAAPVTQEVLRGHDLHDPVILEKFVQVHASGLGVLTLRPDALAGGLYRSIFLFMNLLRAHSDFAVLCVGPELGDVEKAVLQEADQWLLTGRDDGRDAFLRMESALGSIDPDPKRLLGVWLGDGLPRGPGDPSGREWVRVPWDAAMSAAVRGG